MCHSAADALLAGYALEDTPILGSYRPYGAYGGADKFLQESWPARRHFDVARNSASLADGSILEAENTFEKSGKPALLRIVSSLR